ncbi:MAG: hypothetical protein S0880_19030, partial [Actinomycetota bacterium]|nr:hypothetical protein [Actinomycetota bacterium]
TTTTSDPTLGPAIGDGTEDVGEAGPATTTTEPAPTSTETSTTPSSSADTTGSTAAERSRATAAGEAETTTSGPSVEGEAEEMAADVQNITGPASAIAEVLGAVEINVEDGTLQLRIASDTARTALVWAIWVASTLVIMALWLPLPVRLGQAGNSVPRRR